MYGSIGYYNKRQINELLKNCLLDMNGLNNFASLNIIPLHSYVVRIGMDWLDTHHVVSYCNNKSFTCLDGKGQKNIVKGIPRPISKREISALQLKRCFRKGCHLYSAHLQEPENCKSPSLVDFPILQDFAYVFKEIPSFPSKRGIDFSIDLMTGAA